MSAAAKGAAASVKASNNKGSLDIKPDLMVREVFDGTIGARDMPKRAILYKLLHVLFQGFPRFIGEARLSRYGFKP